MNDLDRNIRNYYGAKRLDPARVDAIVVATWLRRPPDADPTQRMVAEVVRNHLDSAPLLVESDRYDVVQRGLPELGFPIRPARRAVRPSTWRAAGTAPCLALAPRSCTWSTARPASRTRCTSRRSPRTRQPSCPASSSRTASRSRYGSTATASSHLPAITNRRLADTCTTTASPPESENRGPGRPPIGRTGGFLRRHSSASPTSIGTNWSTRVGSTGTHKPTSKAGSARNRTSW